MSSFLLESLVTSEDLGLSRASTYVSTASDVAGHQQIAVEKHVH